MYITENPHRKMLDFYIMPQGNEVEPHLGQSKSRQGQLLFSCQGALAAAFWAVLLCGVWYRTGHRLAFVHDNAEVCLPSKVVRKSRKVAAKRAPIQEKSEVDGPHRWLCPFERASAVRRPAAASKPKAGFARPTAGVG